MVRKMKPTNIKKRKVSKKTIEDNVRKDIEHELLLRRESKNKVYKFGFWIFFVLAVFSVAFSVWAISSIYSNFQAVTKILDQSFDRTNLLLDITSSKIFSCQSQLQECRTGQVTPVNAS